MTGVQTCALPILSFRSFDCYFFGHSFGALWKRRGLLGIDTARFMVRTLPMLEDIEGFETEVIGEVPDYREADGEVLITTDVDEDADRPDWFSLKVHVLSCFDYIDNSFMSLACFYRYKCKNC